MLKIRSEESTIIEACDKDKEYLPLVVISVRDGHVEIKDLIKGMRLTPAQSGMVAEAFDKARDVAIEQRDKYDEERGT